MADSFKITDGTTEIELVYDAVSQTQYRMTYGASLGLPQPNVLMHEPDFAEPVPVRGIDSNRMAVFSLHMLPDTDWDTIQDGVTALKRMVDGADSQALRYWTDGDVDRVVLRVQLDGMTNYTDIPIKHGLVDDGGSYYDPLAIINKLGHAIGVALVVSPYGEGAAISLENNLASSPHCIEFNTSSTLADGWTKNGTPTLSAASVNWLIGGMSQRVAASSGGQSVYIDTTQTDTNMVGYVWVHVTSGTALVTFRDTTAATTFKQVTVTEGNSDKSAVDTVGNTWYRISFSTSSGTATNNLRIEIGASGGAAVYYVDGVYLQFGTTTIPDAWCSTSSLKNRYDPSVSESNINYIDFWGIPGDSDALVTSSGDLTTGGQGTFMYAYRYPDGNILAANVPHWLESSNFSVSSGSWSAQTGTTNNHYFRLSGAASGYIYETMDWDAFVDNPASILLHFRASNTAVTVGARVRSNSSLTPGGITFWTGDTKTPQSANTWETIELGLCNLTGLYKTSGQVVIEIVVTNASGYTADIDAVQIFPVGGATENIQTHIENYSGGVATAYDIFFYADEKSVRGTDSEYIQPHVGELWHAKSGQATTRTVYIPGGSDGEYDILTKYNFSFTITPRTRHLLGVK